MFSPISIYLAVTFTFSFDSFQLILQTSHAFSFKWKGQEKSKQSSTFFSPYWFYIVLFCWVLCPKIWFLIAQSITKIYSVNQVVSSVGKVTMVSWKSLFYSGSYFLPLKNWGKKKSLSHEDIEQSYWPKQLPCPKPWESFQEFFPFHHCLHP